MHIKNGALKLTTRLISRDSKQASRQHRSGPEHTRCCSERPGTAESEEWKGTAAEKNTQGRDLSIDSLRITPSDVHGASWLLIMAKTYAIGACCVTRSQEQSVDCCVRRLVRQGPTIFPQLSPFSGSASSCRVGEGGCWGCACGGRGGGGGQLKMEDVRQERVTKQSKLSKHDVNTMNKEHFLFLTTANV